MSVPSPHSFHALHGDNGGVVTSFGRMEDSDFWINAGYFCLRREVFDVIEDGDELVEAPFQRLVTQRQLGVFRYRGFWGAMDTFKDKITFDRMDGRGERPWAVWKNHPNPS